MCRRLRDLAWRRCTIKCSSIAAKISTLFIIKGCPTKDKKLSSSILCFQSSEKNVIFLWKMAMTSYLINSEQLLGNVFTLEICPFSTTLRSKNNTHQSDIIINKCMTYILHILELGLLKWISEELIDKHLLLYYFPMLKKPIKPFLIIILYKYLHLRNKSTVIWDKTLLNCKWSVCAVLCPAKPHDNFIRSVLIYPRLQYPTGDRRKFQTQVFLTSKPFYYIILSPKWVLQRSHCRVHTNERSTLI